jgi:hypothetical protein
MYLRTQCGAKVLELGERKLERLEKSIGLVVYNVFTELARSSQNSVWSNECFGHPVGNLDGVSIRQRASECTEQHKPRAYMSVTSRFQTSNSCVRVAQNHMHIEPHNSWIGIICIVNLTLG